jgi:hypothetical protein
MRTLIGAVAVCAALGWMVACEAREWADKSGTYKVEAELVEVRDGKVLLRKQDGKVISVPLDRLSDRDRQFVSEHSAPAPGGKLTLGTTTVTIKHHQSGSMSMGAFGHMQYSVTYALERQVPKLKLKVVHFERVVPVKVPLALETGLGL